MRDRIKQLEVRRVYKTRCDDLMLCLNQIAYIANNIRLNWKLACQASLVARELTVASHTGHSSGTMSNQQEAEISSAIAAIDPSESKVLQLKIMRVSVKH